MIRRNAQKGIQIARRGYLSFIEKGNIGVINYSQTDEDSTYDVVKLQKQLEYWIDEPSRIRAIVFSGCDAIFDDLNHLTERNSSSEETSVLIKAIGDLAETITQSLTPTVMLSSEKGMSDFAKQIHNLTDYNIPTPVKEQNKVIDEIVDVATNGSTNEIRNFCQKRSPRKPNNRFAKEAYCKKMLLEYESQFITLLDQNLPGFEDETENTTKMSKSS